MSKKIAISNALINPIISTWEDGPLPGMLADMQPTGPSIQKVTPAGMAVEPNEAFIRALSLYMKSELGEDLSTDNYEYVGIGSKTTIKGNEITYVELGKGPLHSPILVSYNNETGKINISRYDALTKKCEATDWTSFYTKVATFLALLPKALMAEDGRHSSVGTKCGLFYENYKMLCHGTSPRLTGDAETDMHAVYDQAMEVYCAMYDMLLNEDILLQANGNAPSVPRIPLAKIQNGQECPSKVLSGEFRVFQTVEGGSEGIVNLEIAEGEYSLKLSRELTDFEKTLIPEIPNSHVISQEEVTTCKEVFRTWEKTNGLRIANMLFEGGAGSGKSELARVLAARFNIPYVTYCCSPNMTEDNISGMMLPEVGEDKRSNMSSKDSSLLDKIYATDNDADANKVIAKSLGIPNQSEMYYDPEGSWEVLTGEIKDEVTPSDCFKIANEKISGELKRLVTLCKDADGGDGVKYKFFPSPILQAFKNGYLLEIQEPSCIKDPAVLTFLNDAFERSGTGVIDTQIGPVTRHPDFMVIYTTNRNYQGTRPLNASVRDRIQLSLKMETPSVEVMAMRAMAKTGFLDNRAMAKLASAVKKLDEEAEKIGIDGIAGMRSLFQLADAIKDGVPAREAIKLYVLYGMTTDEDQLEELRDVLDDCDLNL